MSTKKELQPTQHQDLLKTLKARFEKNMQSHKGLVWDDIAKRLSASDAAEKLWSLSEMENTGGEPDVVGQDEKSGAFLFYDCSPESPAGRRSLCYDQQSWESRKANKPASSALQVAAKMGIELLSEEEYWQLQQLGQFDLKTSSWLKTPPEVRNLGGAIFGDCRFGRIFTYHNGAESYYAARGFRGVLKV